MFAFKVTGLVRRCNVVKYKSVFLDRHCSIRVTLLYKCNIQNAEYSGNFLSKVPPFHRFALFLSVCNQSRFFNTCRNLLDHLMYPVFYELFCYVTPKPDAIFPVCYRDPVCSKDEVNYPRRHSLFTFAIRPSRSCLSYLLAKFLRSPFESKVATTTW